MTDVLFIIEYLGTFVFAITGASIAVKSDFDFFGMLFLAFLTAVGGGTVRDLILDQPVFWTAQPQVLYIIIFATIVTFFFRMFSERASKLIFFLDTLGLGLFVVTGTQKSLSVGSNYETALLMGIITGVLGGILRSIFNSEVPIIFKNEVYATTAAISSLIYMGLTFSSLSHQLNTFITIVMCLIIRYASVKYNIHLPKAL
jgi:uncharacterized membrane protein YeiH